MIYKSPFKGDMFTCKADSKKHSDIRGSVRSCFLHVPRCFLIGEKLECSISEVVPVQFHFISCSADSRFLLRGTLGSQKFIMSLDSNKKKRCTNMNGHLNIPSLRAVPPS